MKKPKTISLLVIATLLLLFVWSISHRSTSSLISPSKSISLPTTQGSSSPASANLTSKNSPDSRNTIPSTTQQLKITEFGKLSKEKEEQLRLQDYKTYLHYKSRLDGERDAQLIGLTASERKQVIKDRVRKRIVDKLNKQPEENPSSKQAEKQ